MPVPSTVADLSATASSNSPAGSDAVGTTLDDYLRSHAAIIKQVSDAKADTSHTQASTTISDSTAAGRTLLTAADASAQRTALGLGTAATATLGTGAGQVPTANQIAGLVPAELPTQTGNSGKVLVTDGANAAWGNSTGSTSAQSMVRVNTSNNNGSTNTAIRRFSNTLTNQGSDITYADSATLGASFTINTAGVYAVTYCDGLSSGASQCGITLNTTNPAMTIDNVSFVNSEILSHGLSGGANFPASVAWTGYLAQGSVIRPHTNWSSGNLSVASRANFTISRVS